MKINRKYIKTIANLYKNQESVVKVGMELSLPFKVNEGLRQGCCLSPTLFKIYLNEILQEWQRKFRGNGIEINEDFLYTLLVADDQIIMANDDYDIEYMMKNLADYTIKPDLV